MIKVLVLISLVSVFLIDIYVPNIICILPVLMFSVTLSYYVYTKFNQDNGLFVRVGMTLITNVLVFTIAVVLDFILDYFVYIIDPHAGQDGVVEIWSVASDLVDDFHFLLLIVFVTSMLTILVINVSKSNKPKIVNG